MTPCAMQKECGVQGLQVTGALPAETEPASLQNTKQNRGISELPCVEQLVTDSRGQVIANHSHLQSR